MTRRVGFIGYGGIARPVIQAVVAGALPGWTVAGVLAREMRHDGDTHVGSDPDTFFADDYDLIVEAAGPDALAAHGVRAISTADVWTTSGAALCDETLLEAITEAGARHRHRMRVLGGALAGLDGVVSASVDPAAVVRVSISSPNDGDPIDFSGSAREAGIRFPNEVNVSAAVGLGGPGLDATTVDIRRDPSLQRHEISVVAKSRYGEHIVTSRPVIPAGSHPVAACVIAALRSEDRVLWVG
jgi:aspartate dehydrogenase